MLYDEESVFNGLDPYWLIDTGQIYRPAQGAFVTDAPEEAVETLYSKKTGVGEMVVADKAFLRLEVLAGIARGNAWILNDELKTAADRRADIQAQLDAIDNASIRPQRAVSTGKGTPDDEAKLAALEAEAEALRAELAALGLPEGHNIITDTEKD